MAWQPKSGRPVRGAWQPKSGRPVVEPDAYQPFDPLKPPTALGPEGPFTNDDPVEPESDEKPRAAPEAPSKAEALMLGEGQGLTLGYGDELQGALDSGRELVGRIPGLDAVRPPQTAIQKDLDAEVGKVPVGRALLDAYRNGRDQTRGFDEAAEKAEPGTYLGGDLLGSFAIPMPPGAQAAAGASKLERLGKAAVRVGKSALAGGVAALGGSDADLTKGEVEQAAKDTGVGVGVGGLAGALAEGASALKGVFGAKKDKAIADALAKATAKKEAEVASSLGKYRSGVQSASRDLEVLTREAEAMPPGKVKDEIDAFLKSKTALQLREQVAGNKLGTAPDRLDEMSKLLQEYKALAAGKDAAIAQETEKALSGSTAARKVGRFLYNYAARMGPALVGFGVGASHGGVAGALGGTALGGVLGMVGGHPGTALKNLSKDPAVRRITFGALEHVLGTAPEALGKYTGLLTYAARHGKEALLELHDQLLGTDPDYVRQFLGGEPPADDGKPKVSPADYGSQP